MAKIEWRGVKVKQEVRLAVVRGLKAAVEPIAADARRLVPVDEGDLRRSIREVIDVEGLRGFVTEGGKGARHAHLVEFGTEKMRAQPHLAPAFDANVDEARRRFAAEVAREL